MAVQVDVVEAQSAALLERLGKAGDFGNAESAHAAFLAAVLEQTLLTSPRVAKSLSTIYGLCTRLCSLVQVMLAVAPVCGAKLVKRQWETGIGPGGSTLVCTDVIVTMLETTTCLLMRLASHGFRCLPYTFNCVLMRSVTMVAQ